MKDNEQKIIDIINKEIGYLTRFNVDIKINSDNMYIDRSHEFIVEVDIRCIDFTLGYKVCSKVDTRAMFNKFEYVFREVEIACSALADQITDRTYKDFISTGLLPSRMQYAMNRYCIRNDIFLEAFKRLELISKDIDSAVEVLRFNNVDVDRFYDITPNNWYGRINFKDFHYRSMRTEYYNSDRRITHLSKKYGSQDVFGSIIKDLCWICYSFDDRARGRNPSFMNSIYDIVKLNREVMEQIELYNAY